MKRLIAILLFSIFSGCGASSDYSKSVLNRNFYSDKILYFKLNSKSQDWLDRKGSSQTIFGPEEQPNVQKEFQRSIQELALETKLNIKILDSTDNNLSPNMIIVDVKISKLLWKFGFSTAIMYSEATYTISENQVFKIKGSHNAGGAGNASNTVKKAFKNTTYNFLKELENSHTAANSG
ncbi:MAG TPA: hypothetical protein VF676_03165 [Flavobacterium sp.]|jgi:hypothetical protein